jgi:hypothetical protein
MAVIIPAVDGATYLRFDGLRINFAPEKRADGAWTVPPDRAVEVHLYAYASAAARSARAAPIWDEAFACKMEDIGAVAGVSSLAAAGPVYAAVPMTPAEIWTALYEQIKAAHPGAADDLAARLPAGAV